MFKSFVLRQKALIPFVFKQQKALTPVIVRCQAPTMKTMELMSGVIIVVQ
jgi:hypothetical protein